MATEQPAKTPIEGHPPAPSIGSGQALDFLFHPRSVAIAGASPPQPGFGGMGSGFVISLQEMGLAAVYPVNPHHEDIEGLKCYTSLLDIEGPVDHVISSVPARAG